MAEEISRELGLTVANEVRREKEYVNKKADPSRQAVKERLRRIACGTLAAERGDIERFLLSLRKQGVGIEPVKNKKGDVYGLRFRYDGQTFKASEIGREFGYRSLLNHFGIEAPGQKGTGRTKRYGGQFQTEQTQSLNAETVIDILLSPLWGTCGNFDEGDMQEEMNRIKRKKKKKYGIRF